MKEMIEVMVFVLIMVCIAFVAERVEPQKCESPAVQKVKP